MTQNKPNKRFEWTLRRMGRLMVTNAPERHLAFAGWHVMVAHRGGEFRAILFVLKTAIRNRYESFLVRCEIWWERHILGKTDEDFDREFEEFSNELRQMLTDDPSVQAQGAVENK